MRFIIEARFLDADSSDQPTLLLAIERRDARLDPSTLGLTLQEGRDLLRSAQQALVSGQVARWLQLRSHCRHCGSQYPHKDFRSVTYRSIFGRVQLPSPRWYRCACRNSPLAGRLPRPTWSPLTSALRQRVSPCLERLQVEFAAHMPYARAVELLNEVLPLEDCISVSGTKNRVRAVAAQLEEAVADAVEALPTPTLPATSAKSVSLLAIDSVWLRHCRPGRMHQRQVSIATARATLGDGSNRVCGYVTKQVARSSKRMDAFLSRLGVQPHERVTAIADAAVEFETAIAESPYTGLRIIDWFHIAMKFRAAEQSAFGARDQPWTWIEPKAVELRLQRAKWRLWNGRSASAIEAIASLVQIIETLEDEPSSTLIRNLEKLQSYLESNQRYMINYGQRYRAGLPISSAPAESAVNELVSVRMAKRQQMRWTDKGAHALVQVRAALLNGELQARRQPAPWYRRAAVNAWTFDEHLEPLAA